MNSPEAAAMPAFRAYPTPPFAFLILNALQVLDRGDRFGTRRTVVNN
nr:hypothetical protein [Ornithinimicrobium cryptoxanthini]